MAVNLKKKIKVLRIIARLNIGGPAVHTILLTEGLNNNEFDSILVTGTIDKGEKDMLYFAKSKNVMPIIIPQLKRKINLFNDAIAFWKIFCIVKKERPDIIHTHTAKAGALGRGAGVLYNLTSVHKCKLIHTFHGTVLEGYFGWLASRIFLLIERISGFFTDTIIVVSGSIKKDLLSKKIGSPQKIAVIPLGLELEKLLALNFDNARGSLLRIGIVGRLVPIKNHRLFLGAAKEFLDNYKESSMPLRFIIFGDGELRQELEEYALQLGIKELVDFHGWGLDVCEIYQNIDVIVLTSLNEGTPVSLIEAMAAARPVIATEVGGVRDLFVKNTDYIANTSHNIRTYANGILFNSGDAEGLVEALKILQEDSQLRKEMGNSGRLFVRDRFSKERLIKDIKMLYNNTLKDIP